ncbi:MAG TPA: cytochrome P450, partial [Acidimicrobiales bacterium]|nr:cytochrome P450 [Acidimicrobiales bacterium]
MELNPFSYEFHADPYPTYRWLRDNAPCYRNEALGFWALTRYADVLDASRDWETFSSADGPMIEKMSDDHRFLPMLINLDPPRHDELRSLVSRVFTPRRVAALEAEARRIAAQYLDRLAAAGGGDFVTEFSALLPMDMIFAL